MFQAFTIMLREGLESFIVVAIIITYLLRTSRRDLLPAAWLGVAAAVVASAVGTYFLAEFGENTLQEGITCIVAALLTGTMVVWMWKTGRYLRRDIEAQIDTASSSERRRGFAWPALGVFLAAFVLIAREGAEAAFLLVGLAQGNSVGQAFVGAVAGFLLSLGFGAFWLQNSRRMNLGVFFQVTGLFLLIFVAQLLLTGVHEMAEAGMMPYARSVHEATEPWVEQGVIARWITVLMVALPGAWLVALSLKHRLAPAPTAAGAPTLKVNRPS